MGPRHGIQRHRPFIGHDHALQGQQSIHPRRRQAGLGGDFARDLDRAGQRNRIHRQAPGAVLRLDRQRNLEGAALEALAGKPPRRRLQPVIAGRRAQPHVQAAAVDALGFPTPAQPLMTARAFGETRHAGESHLAAPKGPES